MLVRFPDQLFNQFDNAIIVNRTAVPCQQNSFFDGELFLSPMEGSTFGIFFRQPGFNIVLDAKLTHGPPADRRHKRHQDNEPETESLTPEVAFFKEVRHWSPSA